MALCVALAQGPAHHGLDFAGSWVLGLFTKSWFNPTGEINLGGPDCLQPSITPSRASIPRSRWYKKVNTPINNNSLVSPSR